MTGPLDLEPIRDRPILTAVVGMLLTGSSAAHFNITRDERNALLAEVDKLRDEITDRANVEADLRAQLAEAKAEADMWANR